MERRYRSPYRHWVSGFFFEVALFVVFLILLTGMALALSRLVG